MKQSNVMNLYKCDVCKDTGWIIENNESMQPTFKRCKCQDINSSRNIWVQSGINPDNSDKTFKTFEVINELTKNMKDITTNYYMKFKSIRNDRKNSIAFLGQPGCGKTHLTIALGLNFLKNKINVVYMPYRDVITTIKQNMLDSDYYKKTLVKYQTADILLIDDLFKGKITEADTNIVFEIINYRYLNKLPVIISSEHLVEKLLGIDEAIGSRIYEMCKDFIIEIEGKENNYRLKQD